MLHLAVDAKEGLARKMEKVCQEGAPSLHLAVDAKKGLAGKVEKLCQEVSPLWHLAVETKKGLAGNVNKQKLWHFAVDAKEVERGEELYLDGDLLEDLPSHRQGFQV